MHSDALIVITIKSDTKKILFSETGRLPTGSSDPLILECRVWVVAILRHIGIDLILSNDD